MALFFAALQGVADQPDDSAAFRRVSPWVQMVSMSALVMLLLITPGQSMSLKCLLKRTTACWITFRSFCFSAYMKWLNPEGTLILQSSRWQIRRRPMLVAIALFVFDLPRELSTVFEKGSRGKSNPTSSPNFASARGFVGCCAAHCSRHPLQRGAFHFIGRIFQRSPNIDCSRPCMAASELP
jgi:hypothetical protein